MNPDEILKKLLADYDGISMVDAWGEISLFYNPNHRLPRGVYFATIKERDGDNDTASNLDREDVFRLNIGTSKPLYIERFGQLPKRPLKGKVIDGEWQFSKANELMPHPIYGWMGWVSVINPTEELFSAIRPIIDAAYEKATLSFAKRIRL